MENGHPSKTALTAAAARAAHLIVDSEPLIFEDRLAAPLLGSLADELIGYHRQHGSHLVLAGARAQVVIRSRYAEHHLARAARRGVTQYLILGAGLDSFAYRSELAGRLSVFEADHPASLRWKRATLAAAGVTVPPAVAFVPVDVETDSLGDRLAAAGLDPSCPVFVSWLGVTMYLSRDAIDRTLAAISEFAPGSEIVADYMLPARLRDADGNAYADQVMPVFAERGEPWLTCLSPDEAAATLAAQGFEVTEQVQQRDAVGSALWNRSDALRPFKLSMIARATVAGQLR